MILDTSTAQPAPHEQPIGLWHRLATNLCLCALGFFLLGCKTNNKVYRKPIEKVVGLLNPKYIRQSTDYMIGRNIFGQFLTYDSFGNIQPGVIGKHELSADGKTYTFEVNPQALFHDHKPVTSDDVIFSIHYLAEKDSLVSRYFANIEGYEDYFAGRCKTLSGIKKINDQCLQIRLKKKSLIFLVQLADYKLLVLPHQLRGKSQEAFFESPIGTGPYKFVRINPERTKLTLERFDQYYRAKSNIKFYELITLSKEEAKKQFEEGRLEDLATFTLMTEDRERLKGRAKFYSPSASSNNLLFLNGRKLLFQDKFVRKRIASAIDVNAATINIDNQLIPTTSLVPYGLLGWSNKKEVSNEKTLLFPKNSNKKRSIKILTYLWYKQKPMDGIVKKILQDIESKTEFSVLVNYQDPETLEKTYLAGEYDILLDNILVRGPDPFNIFTFFDYKSPHDLIFFKDDYVSKKFSEIEEMTSGQRSQAYAELSNYITQEQYYAVPLYTEVVVYVFSQAVKFKSNPGTFYTTMAFEVVDL